MKTLSFVLFLLILLLVTYFQKIQIDKNETVPVLRAKSYWLVLQRKSNLEYLYFGEPDNKENSALVKVFKVKSGIPGERPTPLPKLVGSEFWIITAKSEVLNNSETSPYFLTLNVPLSENSPFGPEPYLECNGQCNWELPGAFGLHGNNGDPEKLSKENPGSSGCIRHTVEDITYLYNLLTPENQEIRYYIEDV